MQNFGNPQTGRPRLDRPHDGAPMVAHVLWTQAAFKAVGIDAYFVLLHEPRFDDTGKLTGCTCEEWRRANRDPNFVCRTPGKHPRFNDWEDRATNDPKEIRKLYRRFPTANIGLAVGKSRLLALDEDTYKESYKGRGLLAKEEEETVRQISGGKGVHTLYRMPPGKDYGNQTGDLPDGIDIRGHGGMIVLAPSLHPSGNRYQWENDYGPDEIDLLPVPARLCEILDRSQERSRGARAVHFDQVDTVCPDLSLWALSGATIERINEPAAVGSRSEHDFGVVLALCRAGATNDQIRAVFRHYPIGTRGKYAERGDRYLSRTIENARARLESEPAATPPADPETVRANVDQMAGIVKAVSFEPYIDPELIGARYGSKLDTDRAVALALLKLCHKSGSYRVAVSLRGLGRMAGMDHKTVRPSLQRLSPWFCAVGDDGLIEVVSQFPTSDFVVPKFPTFHDVREVCNKVGNFGMTNSVGNLASTYVEQMGADPFLTGTSRTKRAQAEVEAIRRGVVSIAQVIRHDTKQVIVDDLAVDVTKTVIDDVTQTAVEIHGNPFTPEQMVENGYDVRILPPWRVVLREYMAGLGKSVLTVIDALEIHGESSRAELVELTGKSYRQISRATLRAESLGLILAEQESPRSPKVYSLAADWADSVDLLSPHLRTHKLGVERELRDHAATMGHCDRELRRVAVADDMAEEEKRNERKRLHKRRGRAERRYRELLPIIHEWMTEEDVDRWVTTPNATNAIFDYSPIMKEERSKRLLLAMQTVSDIIIPGAILNRGELAAVRDAAGRLGLNAATMYESLSVAGD